MLVTEPSVVWLLVTVLVVAIVFTFNHAILRDNHCMILHQSEGSLRCFYILTLNWTMSSYKENALHWVNAQAVKGLILKTSENSQFIFAFENSR